MRFMFTNEELKELDGLPGVEEEEEEEAPKPDLLNLDGKDASAEGSKDV